MSEHCCTVDKLVANFGSAYIEDICAEQAFRNFKRQKVFVVSFHCQ